MSNDILFLKIEQLIETQKIILESLQEIQNHLGIKKKRDRVSKIPPNDDKILIDDLMII